MFEINEFIERIRKDRNLEILAYKEKNYKISNYNEYRFVETIQILISDTLYSFGVQVVGGEIYFYICDQGSNIYLKIDEIYSLLYAIAYLENTKYVIDSLKSQLYELEKYVNDDSNSEFDTFKYKDSNFKLSKIAKFDQERTIGNDRSSIEIKYIQLFLLILLIQSKSNSLFLKGKKKQYLNGIVRLLICLIYTVGGNEYLNKLGWIWDNEKNMYTLIADKVDGNKKNKYYLTQEEYEDIIPLES